MDQNMLKHLSKEYKSEYGSTIDPSKKVKSKMRMLDRIEKTRVNLTSNHDIDIFIDSLLENNDLSYSTDRD